MTGLPDQDGTFWMTRDIETGLFEISRQVADAAAVLRMPMTGGGPGGGAETLQRYRSLMDAANMPDGRVVRMNFEADGNATSVTLMSMEPGAAPGRHIHGAGRLRTDADALDSRIDGAPLLPEEPP